MSADANYPAGDFADRHGEEIGPLTLKPDNGGASYDDIFKVSHCTDCTFEDIIVSAGLQRENALDLNRESNGNYFRRLTLTPGGQGAILIKGGSSVNTFDDVLIVRPSGHTDIMIGGYSGQSKSKSIGNRFHQVRRSDGEPVRVAWTFTRASKPIITGSKVRYQYGWSLIRTIAMELKYLLA